MAGNVSRAGKRPPPRKKIGPPSSPQGIALNWVPPHLAKPVAVQGSRRTVKKI